MTSLDQYRASVRFLEELANIETGVAHSVKRASVHLRQTSALLRALGNPHTGSKTSYIHITGTAGKGTVATMIGHALRASGARVGVHTSPYTTTFLEQFWVNGNYVAAAQVVAGIERLRPILDRLAAQEDARGPSYLAARFALASLLFYDARVRWRVIEAGMGGRFDHSNVIPPPRVAVITNIGQDHLDVIGPTLRHVAREKAGVVKRGTVLITGERRPILRDLLRRETERRGGRFRPLPIDLLRTLGPAEENPFLARAVGEELRLPVRAVEQGIADARIPGRLEVLQRRPIVILDGAHNALKAEPLAELLRSLAAPRRHLVVAMAADKASRDFLRTIVPLVNTVTATRFLIQARKAAHPALLTREARNIRRIPVRVMLDPHQALDAALHNADADDVVVVTGSLYLVGLLRARWISEEAIVAARSSFPASR